MAPLPSLDPAFSSTSENSPIEGPGAGAVKAASSGQRYEAWLTDDMLKSGTRSVGIRAQVK